MSLTTFRILAGAVAAATMVSVIGASSIANAATINIVAIGASNTEGRGVGRSHAYPTQLETILRGKGYDAHVMNAGISGDTTARMLARLDSAVPSGTQLVILQPGGNDFRSGVTLQERRNNVHAIIDRLRARNIEVIVAKHLNQLRRQYFQANGVELTSEGHRLIAAKLATRVIATLNHPTQVSDAGNSVRHVQPEQDGHGGNRNLALSTTAVSPSPARDEKIRAQAGREGIPLPPTIGITPPSDSTPAELAAYVGGWGGDARWNGKGRQILLIITDVSGSGEAHGIFGWGPPPPQAANKAPANFTEFEGSITQDGLRFVHGPWSYQFSRKGQDLILGYASGRNNRFGRIEIHRIG